VAIATLTFTPSGATPDNTQKHQILTGSLTLSATGDYAPGGLALDSVMAPFAETNSPAGFTNIMSTAGSGYIYQRIASTGKMMILQVPLSGSLTTAAPLSELLAGNDLSQVRNDRITVQMWFKRNS
jgi:hypothetical protein